MQVALDAGPCKHARFSIHTTPLSLSLSTPSAQPAAEIRQRRGRMWAMTSLQYSASFPSRAAAAVGDVVPVAFLRFSISAFTRSPCRSEHSAPRATGRADSFTFLFELLRVSISSTRCRVLLACCPRDSLLSCEKRSGSCQPPRHTPHQSSQAGAPPNQRRVPILPCGRESANAVHRYASASGWTEACVSRVEQSYACGAAYA